MRACTVHLDEISGDIDSEECVFIGIVAERMASRCLSIQRKHLDRGADVFGGCRDKRIEGQAVIGTRTVMRHISVYSILLRDVSHGNEIRGMQTVACQLHIGKHIPLLEVEFMVMVIHQGTLPVFLHVGDGA